MMFSQVFSRSALFFLLVFSIHASGQSAKAPVIDVTSSMLTWVKHLNNDLDKYFTREKGKDLNQNFEALKQELNSYIKARKALSDSLFRNNIAPGKKDPDNLELLKVKMSAIMQQMRNVTDLTSNELRAEGDRLNEEIYNVLYGQEGRFLSNLEVFLAGMDVTKKDLALDGSANYQRLQDCVHLISGIQDKIERKMK